MNKIDLDKPAFGKDAQKVEDIQNNEQAPMDTTTPASQAKDSEGVQDNAPSSAENGDETRIPYSRFKKVHEKALEAEREAKLWRERAEQAAQFTQSQQQRSSQEEELPTYWINLFGDSDASREAYKLEQVRFQNLKKEAIDEFKREQETQKSQQHEAIQESLSAIEEGFENVEALAGRNLSEKEKEKILDIVDEYSPKDRDGNYIAHIPFEKAWDIYKAVSKVTQTPAQKQALQATGTDSEGNAKVDEKTKNFNPMDWNAYRRRI